MFEVLEDVSKDVKVYRFYCYKIVEVVRLNIFIIISFNDIFLNMNDDLNCGDVIYLLNDVLEDVFILFRKCSIMGYF